MSILLLLVVVLLDMHVHATVLPLYKLALPNDIASLRARDELRHSHTFKAMNYTLGGNTDPSSYGLYYAVVTLGTPPREFKLQIDTGSDLTWVACQPCHNCPEANYTPVYRHPFDAAQSPTASFNSCPEHPSCSPMNELQQSGCSTDNNMCKYKILYGDNSSTSGYFVSDMLSFSSVPTGTSNSSTRIFFGCSFLQTGFKNFEFLDIYGIIGLSRSNVSVTSQLVNKGIVPNVFSHCLRGYDIGGGSLVLGDISEPNIEYTPLQKQWLHYMILMEGMSVGGIDLGISSVNVVVDSGTTLGYLVAEIFDPLIVVISSGTLDSSTYNSSGGYNCYILSHSSRISDLFPEVRLIFAGGASMILQPQDYMLLMDSFNGTTKWCLGFLRATEMTILGDVVLKDKIIEYDMVHGRLGMAKFNCSLPLKISISSSQTSSCYLISIVFMILLASSL